MKKFGIILLVAFLIVNTMPVIAATNLLTTNVDFENSTAVGWGAWETTEWNIEVTKNMSHSGVRSLCAEAIADKTTANLTLTYRNCPALEVGKYYIFSAWINIPTWNSESGDGFKMRVTQTEAPTEAYSENFAMATTNGWKRISFTFYASTTNPQLRLLLAKDVKKGSVIYVDDISLETVEDFYNEKYAKEFSYISDYGITRKGIVATQTMDDISKWKSDNAEVATISVDQTVKIEGKGSMCIEVKEAGGSTSISWSSSKPSLPEVKEYEISAWVYIPQEYEENVTSIHLYADAKRIKNESNKTTYQQVPTPPIKNTKGTWQRISGVITPEAARVGQMGAFRLSIVATGAAKIYMDDVRVIEKAVQYPVLQVLQVSKDTSGNDVLLDTKAIGAGPFALRYDEHVANAENANKTFCVAIYKETNNVKQLVDVQFGTFTADTTEKTLVFEGVENPDDSYWIEAVLWDGIGSMHGIKKADFVFAE